MNIKIKEKLNSSEVVTLNKYLAATLTRFDIDKLRDDPETLLILSALYELYAKVKDKAENVRIFPSRKGELYSITITRTQALAIICSTAELPKPTSAIQSYEENFLIGLIGRIHQTFLV